MFKFEQIIPERNDGESIRTASTAAAASLMSHAVVAVDMVDASASGEVPVAPSSHVAGEDGVNEAAATNNVDVDSAADMDVLSDADVAPIIAAASNSETMVE